MKNVCLKIAGLMLGFFALAIVIFDIYIDFNSTTIMYVSYALASLIVAWISLYFGGLIYSKSIERGKVKNLFKFIFAFFFISYIYILLKFTLFDMQFGRIVTRTIFTCDTYDFNYALKYQLNYIPFKIIILFIKGFLNNQISFSFFVTNIVGNIIAFMPFAFFLPLFFDKLKKFSKFLITMICIVLLIEFTQFIFMIGTCDIDDLILNVGGAVAFYFFIKIRPINLFLKKVTKF